MGLLDGRIGLVAGIANDRSYAWHIADAITRHGGRCAFTHLPGDKNERRTRKAVEKLPHADADPWLHPLDATDDEQLDGLFTAYRDSFDRLDFVIHSIAFADREWLQEGNFHRTPRQAFLQAIDVSAYTLVAMAARARPQMVATGGGSILAMSYYGSEKVVPGYNVMGVAKSALESSARYLAWELGIEAIRVNTISGGYLRTLSSSAVGGVERIGELNDQRAPLRRNVEGADVGGTAAFLVSDLAAGITGENIYVDCGVNTVGI